jgi:hypothetical protein
MINNNHKKHWILINDKLKEVDMMTWAKWFENGNKSPGRITGRSVVKNVRISTVFLGLDHSFGGEVPVLWETMMFNIRDDSKKLKDKKGLTGNLQALGNYQVRYSSLEDARKGHEYAVRFAEYILGIRKTEPKEE